MIEKDLMTVVTKFAEEKDYTDGFFIETDIEEKVGYYISNYDYPTCNHRDGVTDKNIGYVKGITADGVPFEAELFEREDTLMMSVVIPAIFNDFYETEEEGDENIRTVSCGAEGLDGTVLDIGMVYGTMEKNKGAVRDYVNFLVNHGIVISTPDLLDGRVRYCTDELGNDLAQILITMQSGRRFFAYTNMDFDEFSKK